jgi:flagellar M-ring protein FliF
MQFLRNSWTQVRVYLEGMTPSQKWLILTLLVVLLLTGFIIAQYAGSPQMLPITGFAGDRPAEAVNRLKAAGIPVKLEGGQIYVAHDRHVDALVLLQQNDLMVQSTAAAFDAMFASDSMFRDSSQRKMGFLIAKQKYLSAIIGKMRGVRQADVVISMPEDVGFGRTFVRPSASVNIVMHGSGRMDKNMVHAIAGLVAGSVAEMQPQDVVVIDAVNRQQFTIKSEDQFGTDEAIEQVQRVEQYHREKIESMLRYIPGVIVAVNVQIDNVHRHTQQAIQYSESEPLRRQREEERNREDRRASEEPGARPNLGMNADAGANTGTKETETITESEFGDKLVTQRDERVIVGRQTRQINVSINVPRTFFVALWRQGQPADKVDAVPTDADLEVIREAHLAQIVTQVEPLIAAGDNGVVRAAMIYDATSFGPVAADIGGATGVGALLVGSPWSKPAFVGLLAMAALGFMLYTVRKATTREPMPSIEELAGVPPELPSDDELVGEAGETNATLAGFELDDDELRFREMAGQISDMIKNNPQEAGNLIGRWVRHDD